MIERTVTISLDEYNELLDFKKDGLNKIKEKYNKEKTKLEILHNKRFFKTKSNYEEKLLIINKDVENKTKKFEKTISDLHQEIKDRIEYRRKEMLYNEEKFNSIFNIIINSNFIYRIFCLKSKVKEIYKKEMNKNLSELLTELLDDINIQKEINKKIKINNIIRSNKTIMIKND